jgi:hypothetical protein
MSFRKTQTAKLLSGGLNLLAPGDLLDTPYSVACKNWRVDSAGALRSRNQENLVANVGGAGAVHTLYLANQSDRWIGKGTGLYKGTTSIAAGFSGEPLGLVYFQEALWVMDTSVRGSYHGATWYASYLPTAPAGAPTAAADAAGVLSGDLSYYVTFGTDTYGETNPSPAGTVTVTDKQVSLTGIPTSADARVTKRHIYRGGGALGAIYRVGTIHDNVTTTYTDNEDDESVARLGIQMEEDNDAPPAGQGMAGPYFGRLLAWIGNRLYWSKMNQPQSWPGAAADDGNHAPVGDDGENIVAVRCRGRAARVYKDRSIWKLVGDPDDLEAGLEQSASEVGLIGKRAICSVGHIDYFQAEDGIYAFNGDTAVKISQAIDPIFKSDPIYAGGNLLLPVNGSYRSLARLAHRLGRLYFSYTDSNGSANNCTLVYDLATKAWTHDSRGWTDLYDEGSNGDLLGGYIGVVFALEYPSTANAINLDYTSGYQDQGTRDRQKRYADIVIEHSVKRGAVADAQLTAKAFMDNGLVEKALGSLTVATMAAGDDNRLRTVLRVESGAGWVARNFAYHLDGDVSHETLIYSAELHYQVEPRDALTFDSDEIDLGWPGPKEVVGFEAEIDASGTVSWEVFSNQPGEAMASRDTGTIAATSGIKWIPVLFTPSCEGHLARIVLTATATFRLYRLRVKFQPVALYVDGGRGDQYDTGEVALG